MRSSFAASIILAALAAALALARPVYPSGYDLVQRDYDFMNRAAPAKGSEATNWSSVGKMTGKIGKCLVHNLREGHPLLAREVQRILLARGEMDGNEALSWKSVAHATETPGSCLAHSLKREDRLAARELETWLMARKATAMDPESSEAINWKSVGSGVGEFGEGLLSSILRRGYDPMGRTSPVINRPLPDATSVPLRQPVRFSTKTPYRTATPLSDSNEAINRNDVGSDVGKAGGFLFHRRGGMYLDELE
ncbi:uncharacterized protein FIBRA_00534 [Fibroporia radiculosa]|uniref:Uncharacterized protein n=1 Tax=Fibroporia radiculosa TaxID=599839 RepID=J4GI07_9APHY|nr:uncharacterized protein FIBRA_00534 [Fibroporia radiculosa]CCL98535.1 predicted protein [Fibroporia radiculosa]